MRHCKATRWITALDSEGRDALERYLLDNMRRDRRTGCDLWVGGVTGRYGHPIAAWGGNRFRPYRALWALRRGPLRATELYRHGRDDQGEQCTPLCLNLGHSRGLGSVWDNAQDRKADRGGDCPYGHPYDGLDRRGWRTCSRCLRAARRRYRERLTIPS